MRLLHIPITFTPLQDSKHVSKHGFLLPSRMGDDSAKLINNHIAGF